MTIKLDKIELENFKSYHGKHVIGPFKGFTSVIGPNGCGKSNLMDAISFVLGESALNLRVTSLAGVIHSCLEGCMETEYAAVSAFFTDSTHTHLYERTVQKNGKCEYRLNHQTVTAKSYQESLEELGIVLKARNFLVLQGGIESIALQNPKERARMFDRISGSYKLKDKYDQLKENFQKTLDHAHQGIVAEKNQAKYEKEEAQKYQDFSNSLKSILTQLHLFKLYHIDLEIEQYRRSAEIDQSQLSCNLKELDNLSVEISLKKNDYIAQSKEKSAVQSKLQESAHECDSVRAKVFELEHMCENLSKFCQEMSSKLLKLDSEYSANVKEGEVLEKELAYTKKCRDNYNDEHFVKSSICKNYSQTAHLEYQELIESYNKTYASSLEELNKLNEKYLIICKSHTDVEQKIQSNRKLVECLNNKLLGVNEKKQKLEQFITENSEQASSLETTIESMRAEHSANSVILIKYQQELEIVNEEISSAKFSINSQAQNERNFELTLSLKKNFLGVLGRMVDLCHPAHKKYSIAITKVTQKYMDAFVVDTEMTARECIQFLKDRHEPACLFLPLDSLSSVSINDKYRELGGTSKLLVDVINYEQPQMKKIVDFVCGNTIVCEAEVEAKRIAFYSQRERRKVVTLDGTLFLKSGVISGGVADISAKASKWNQNQLNLLKSKRETLNTKIRSLQSSTTSHLTALHQHSTELNQLKNRIEMAKRQLCNYDDLLTEDIRQQLSTTSEENNQFDNELFKVVQQKSKIEPQVNRMIEKLNLAKEEHFSDFTNKYNFQTIEEFEKAYIVCRSTIEAQQLKYDLEIEKLETKIGTIQNSSILSRIKSLDENLSSKKCALQEAKDELISSKKLLTELTSSQITRNEKLNASIEISNKLDSQLRQLTSENIEKKKSVETLRRKLIRNEDNMNEIITMKHRVLKNARIDNIAIPTTIGDSNDFVEQLNLDLVEVTLTNAHLNQNNYKIDYSSLPSELKMDSNDNIERNQVEMKLQLKIDNFKKEISKLNKPNMKSFDRLERIIDKIKLTDQEIEKCRQNARKSKLEFELCRKERTQLFMETFESVAQCIDGIYKLLTGSPRAQAYLSVDLIDEPYLGNVSFNSIVPGKKYRPMDNLSGGEKTIASLALLFAIHQHRPSPFFILDEIDAALDASNIEKVVNYIRKKSTDENMQFIVISLKEDLYSSGDAAIGVTAHADSNNHIESCLFTLDLTQFS